MREYYGIDAPTVVRNLAIGGALCLALSIVARSAPPGLFHALIPTFEGTGIGMLAGASWMIVSSLWLKAIVCDRLLGSRIWRGDEQALDVGCGRGLVAVAIARRLCRGGAVRGIDLWQSVDLSGNSPEQAVANAKAAGVADHLSIDTGDMRKLPYSDSTFDVVASMTAIHNLPSREDREQAILEIWRVTRPNGNILIFDIRYARDYAKQLQRLGCVVKISGPIILWGPLGWRFSAIKAVNNPITAPR